MTIIETTSFCVLPPSKHRSVKEKTRDRVAHHLGVSYKTLDNLEKVYDAAKRDPPRYGDLINRLDAGRLNQKRRLREEISNQASRDIEHRNVELLEGDFRDVSCIVEAYGTDHL